MSLNLEKFLQRNKERMVAQKDCNHTYESSGQEIYCDPILQYLDLTFDICTKCNHIKDIFITE